MILSSETRIEGVANSFEPQSNGLVHLSPFGQFPHPRGLQHFDATDSAKLVAEFEKAKQLAGRNFVGLPFFEGHPDTAPMVHTNKRAAGWVKQLATRNDGLYANVKWTRAGDELIADEQYKFLSPVWDAVSGTVAGKRVLRPSRLISVGLTNTPNLPVAPLGNDADTSFKKLDSADLGRELGALVNALMIEHQTTYEGAWRRSKLERPDLFERMQHPTKAAPLIPQKKAYRT